jgi:hypothetical protein
MQQLTYFEDVGVKTLQLLDSQFQWDNLQKSQFYKVAILFCKTVFYVNAGIPKFLGYFLAFFTARLQIR